jgi:hypothetical protein
MFRQIEPCALYDLTKLIQYHFAIDDFAKHTFTPMRYDGDIIRARLGIIISLQSNGMAMVNFGIEFHGFPIISLLMMVVGAGHVFQRYHCRRGRGGSPRFAMIFCPTFILLSQTVLPAGETRPYAPTRTSPLINFGSRLSRRLPNVRDSLL